MKENILREIKSHTSCIKNVVRGSYRKNTFKYQGTTEFK